MSRGLPLRSARIVTSAILLALAGTSPSRGSGSVLSTPETQVPPCNANICCSYLPRDCPECDDGNPCTDDSCELVPFDPGFPFCSCINTFNTSNCDDGNPRTKTDKCSSGICFGVATTGNVCDDRNLCTANDECRSGTCVGVPFIDCDDGNLCTLDSCDPGTGTCVHAPACGGSVDPCTSFFCDQATGQCVSTGIVGETGPLLLLDDVTLVWNPAPFAAIHNAYRGTITEPGNRGTRSQIYDHVCFESGDGQHNGQTLTIDFRHLPTGVTFYYLVDGESQYCEGSLGIATDGTPLTPLVSCPTPPP